MNRGVKAFPHWPEAGLFPLKAVGTSYYTNNIARIAGNRYYEPALVFCTVDLIPEKDNPHDESAVLVSINTIPLGYLPKNHAKELRSRLSECDLESQITTCGAVITAGHETSERSFNYQVELDVHLSDAPREIRPRHRQPFRKNGYPELSDIGNGRCLVRVLLPAGLLDDMDKNQTIRPFSGARTDFISYYAQNRVGLGSGYWLFAIPRAEHLERFGQKEAAAVFRSISGRRAVIEVSPNM